MVLDHVLEKSPLLANGYNQPPTHLSPMQLMALGHHPAAAAQAAFLNPQGIPLGSTHPLARPDGSIIKNHQQLPQEVLARLVFNVVHELFCALTHRFFYCQKQSWINELLQNISSE